MKIAKAYYIEFIATIFLVAFICLPETRIFIGTLFQFAFFSLALIKVVKNKNDLLKSFDYKANYKYAYIIIGYLSVCLVFSLTKNIENSKGSVGFVQDFGNFSLIIGEFYEEACRRSYLLLNSSKSNIINFYTVSLIFALSHYPIWLASGNFSFSNMIYAFFSSIIFSYISIKIGWRNAAICHVISNFFRFYILF